MKTITVYGFGGVTQGVEVEDSSSVVEVPVKGQDAPKEDNN